jgi:flagellar biosynthesis protein FlhF
MTTKTFRADTLFEALQQVQTEFGPDAMVLSVREVPTGPAWQVWKHPGCEVIATTNSEVAQKAKPSEPKPSPTVATRTDELPEGVEWIEEPLAKNQKGQRAAVRSDVQAPTPEKKPAQVKTAVPWMPPKLHQYDEELLSSPKFEDINEFDTPTNPVGQVENKGPAEKKLPAPLQANLNFLRTSGLAPALLDRLASLCLDAASPSIVADEKRCRDYLKRQLEVLIRVIPQNQLDRPGKILCLVGASGSGKTSSCARLAAYYTRKGKRVAWINTDTMRAGAVAEARSYAEALNIPLHQIYLPEDIPGQIASEPNADLILVDTPGYNPYQEAQMAELGAFLTQIPGRTTYLLASATMKEADLDRCLSSVRIFSINGLLVTKLDETGSPASIYNFAQHSQIGMAFFSQGKQVINDFGPASCTGLVDELFRKGGQR